MRESWNLKNCSQMVHWCKLTADFYPTVKAALRHESADSEEDRESLGCHLGQGLTCLWYSIVFIYMSQASNRNWFLFFVFFTCAYCTKVPCCSYLLGRKSPSLHPQWVACGWESETRTGGRLSCSTSQLPSERRVLLWQDTHLYNILFQKKNRSFHASHVIALFLHRCTCAVLSVSVFNPIACLHACSIGFEK